MTARFLWKLVFQSGPLAGQVLHLPAGELTVGDQPGCDINFPLSSTHGDHCVLSVDEHGVTLRPLRIRCKVDGRRLKADEVKLEVGQIIDLAGCKFNLARVVEDAASSIEALPVTPVRAAARVRGLRLWGVGLPCIIAGGLVAALLQAGQELRASVSQYRPFNLESYQETLRLNAGLAQIEVMRAESGALTLSGLCQHTSELAPFLVRLDDARIPYSNQVVCVDELHQGVTYLLQANGYRDARVSAGSSLGSVVITGNIHAGKRWETVSQQLNQMPGLASWMVSNDADAVITSLVDTLRECKLLTKLSVARQSGNILTVTGQLPAERQQQLRQVLDVWQKQYEERIRVVYQDIPTSKLQLSILPATVTGFSGNHKTAFLQLANGMKIQIGSILPSGYVVTKLDDGGVELRKDGQLIHLPLDL
ncbi:type III secretion system inner membrane ring subunit SctD [Mycoavidus sp. B2-EB]|uniref:type III secretion system inner membrane ring subunit SctD n=1 Tax=Mycoavidus sp. B2-EB TaxID=2651972 RepID=UPI00162811FD|nr:type III secretion system inner membrane ring subunit SctD [Mycoavidus sp. B2-EB]BBO59069.1 EscD/YscD/HrpQ family type III secretion system inner membrane ring protein [Mycoavidus sp. B2-EB]